MTSHKVRNDRLKCHDEQISGSDVLKILRIHFDTLQYRQNRETESTTSMGL